MVILQAVLEFPLACGISTGTPVRVCFAFAASPLWALTKGCLYLESVVCNLHANPLSAAYHSIGTESSGQLTLSAVWNESKMHSP